MGKLMRWIIGFVAFCCFLYVMVCVVSGAFGPQATAMFPTFLLVMTGLLGVPEYRRKYRCLQDHAVKSSGTGLGQKPKLVVALYALFFMLLMAFTIIWPADGIDAFWIWLLAISLPGLIHRLMEKRKLQHP